MQSYNNSIVLPAMYRVRDSMGRERWVEVEQPVDSLVTREDVRGSAFEEDDLEEIRRRV